MNRHLDTPKIDESRDFVLSNMTEGVLVVDKLKNILMINEPGIAYLDIKIKEPKGQNGKSGIHAPTSVNKGTKR